VKNLRVILADDHTIVRAGIRRMLEQLPGLEVVAEVDHGRELLRALQSHAPDVVVLDISMPELNGVDAARHLHKEWPSVRILFLTVHNNPEYVHRAFQSGALGYVLKNAAVEELHAALQAMTRGETYLSTALRQPLAEWRENRPKTSTTPMQQLTSRQREILQMIAESKHTKEIADLLGLSPKTVEFHRAVLMVRLGVRDVPALVRYAIQSGLIAPESLPPPA
jgi:DNA-binding NarL/FixJ family response regulator